MKRIVLFDMDGTLTPARKSIEKPVIEKLSALQEFADIGIVSGSPYDYIVSQISDLWTHNDSLDPRRIKIMPCNGTKLFQYRTETSSFYKTYDTDMIHYIGKDKYRVLISILTDLQNSLVETQKDLPLSGNFISFRGSMINWCMIGRDADHLMREQFQSMDDGLRLALKFKLDEELQLGNIDSMKTSLGGTTSIDIYPKGWDKTYCLSHIDENWSVYFVGDKCTPEGNDYELFIDERTKSYMTTGPKQTCMIIDDITKEITDAY